MFSAPVFAVVVLLALCNTIVQGQCIVGPSCNACPSHEKVAGDNYGFPGRYISCSASCGGVPSVRRVRGRISCRCVKLQGSCLVGSQCDTCSGNGNINGVKICCPGCKSAGFIINMGSTPGRCDCRT